MRGYVCFLAIVVPALAQDATVPSGVPLRVALEQRVAIKRVGDLLHGRLVDSVYVYDKLAIPAGSVVEGHIATIGGVPLTRRLTSLLNGNLTPRREARAAFDTLVLSDGSRLPLHTAPSSGTAHTMRVGKSWKRNQDKIAGTDRAALLAFKTPVKLSQLKSRLLDMLPYHRQAWQAGTLFTSALEAPLAGLTPRPAIAEPDDGSVTARLVTAISSATAERDAPVEAVVTRPVFSADHTLLIPEGSRLLGTVVQAKRARFLHRNGKVLFEFRQMKLAVGAERGIQGYLEGMETNFDAHLALDPEGTARISSPKARFIFPAIAAAVAGLSFHQDFNSKGIPDQDAGGRAESGAVGLGLIGTVLAQVGPRGLASGIAITGAAFSIYSNFIARGADVVLPVNTTVTISLKPRP